MNLILMVVFIVLMILWLFAYSRPEPEKGSLFVNRALIPWLCVAILGYLCFNGVPIPR